MAIDPNHPMFADQVPINQAIARGLVAFLPESWRTAELRLHVRAEGGVGQQVVNPDTGEGWTVSHEVMMAVLDLDEHRKKHALPWTTGVFHLQRKEANEWKISATFEK